MAPPAADFEVGLESGDQQLSFHTKSATTTSRLTAPLKYTGSLDSFEQFDVTAVIGREFPGLQLSEILHDDAKIRDLAILGEASLNRVQIIAEAHD
jgi:hypothetical protein